MTYRNIPDDFRRDYYDLRNFIYNGQFLTDDNGDPNFQTSASVDRAEEIGARLEAMPHNTIFVQIGPSRYQIEALEDRLVISKIQRYGTLDLQLSIAPKTSNRIEIR